MGSLLFNYTKSLLYLLFNLIVILQYCQGLYEDQIGKFDWRQRYIGKLRYAHIDSGSNGADSITLATEHNVVASISLRNGEIVWRQVLEKGDNGYINALSNEGEVISVSGNGLFLRSWDTNSGVLNWETSLPNIEILDEHLTRFFVSSEKKEIFAVQIKPRSSLKVTVFRILEGNAKSSPQISAPWINAHTSCDFASGTYFVCADPQTKTLQLLNLDNGIGFVEVPLKLLGLQTNKANTELKIEGIPYQDSTSEPVFALHLGEDGVFLGRIEKSGMKIVKVLPKALEVTSAIVNGQLTLFAAIREDNKYKILALSPTDGTEIESLKGEFSLTPDHGALQKFFAIPYLRKDGSTSYKMLVLTSDDALLLIHQQGKVIWTREESLASILMTEIWDLPLSDIDVKIEEEFGATDANVVSMLLTRLSTQLLQLQTFLITTVSRLQGEAETSLVTGNNLVRDKFGLHKVIVAMTHSGKIFGIDNLSGEIIWKKLIPILPLTSQGIQKPFYQLFTQRTTAHFPHPAICTVVGKSFQGDQTYIHSFNPITGGDVATKKLNFLAIQVTMLNEMDSEHVKGIVLLDKSLKVHVFPPSTEEVFLATKNSHYIFVANATNGVVTGYSFQSSKPGSLEATEVWRVTFPPEYQQITRIALKRPTEHVHSQGRVMGDRSVLYKYLNPNLAVVITEGSDPIQKYCLNLYLLDGVTGMIIYSSTHKRARGPVNMVHSENWVVYSYYNEKSRRVEMSSIELYEGKSQSNTSAFSSLSPPALTPIVEHQSFIFPAGVETMTDTVTEKGITNKHILIALPLGGIVELPKAFLDPRRPIQLLAEHREEGLIPYIPELPITSEGIINYNQTVMQIREIYTAPSGLESTCLVFAYGLDLYYTRVTPSKTFDILKDDFDHFLIMAVLIALLLLSYVTRRLAARKALRAAWK